VVYQWGYEPPQQITVVWRCPQRFGKRYTGHATRRVVVQQLSLPRRPPLATCGVV